jgi:hypothetical protein
MRIMGTGVIGVEGRGEGNLNPFNLLILSF